MKPRLFNSTRSNTVSSSWLARLMTLTVWLLAALCAAYWAMKFVSVKPVSASTAQIVPQMVVDTQAVAKLLGATNSIAKNAVNTPANGNYTLFGLANTASGDGVALISTDGKPAKPYRVGGKVSEEWVLKGLTRTQAILAKSMSEPDGMKLDLPVKQAAVVSVIGPPAMHARAVDAVSPTLPTPPVVQAGAPTLPSMLNTPNVPNVPNIPLRSRFAAPLAADGSAAPHSAATNQPAAAAMSAAVGPR